MENKEFDITKFDLSDFTKEEKGTFQLIMKMQSGVADITEEYTNKVKNELISKRIKD